jgi:regulator of sigma E protease
MSEAKYGIVTTELARKIGFMDGDHILQINGKSVEKFNEISSPDVFLDPSVVFTVRRNDTIKKITLPPDIFNQLSEQKKQDFISYRWKFMVKEIESNSNAEKGGLQVGDRIYMVNDSNTEYFNDFQAKLNQHHDQEIKLTVLRNEQEVPLKIKVGADGRLGFRPEEYDMTFKTDFYPFGKSMVVGTNRAMSSLSDNIRGLGKVVRGEVDPTKSLMGPIRLATVFGDTWEWQRFWALTGLLSLILAFMNLLPIPALDGGHAMFLFIEMIIGRPLGDKFMQVTQVIGMVILIALMIFVFGNDIWNLIPGK